MTTTYHNLGCTHQAIVDLIQVKECSERALDIRLKSEGLSQVVVATIYNKLGDVHHDMGGLQQAQAQKFLDRYWANIASCCSTSKKTDFGEGSMLFRRGFTINV